MNYSNHVMAEIFVSALLALAVAAIRLRAPGFGRGVRSLVQAIAHRTWLAILVVAAVPMVARVILLPIVPQRQPITHDEYIHLLVADTIAQGRLTNPVHPFWEHLDTIYVVQKPSYAGVYPIGQGAIFAVGQLLTGNPWVGHVLSLGLMAGALCWMLCGWLPVEWAFAGGLLSALVYGVSGEWAATYLGGPAAAFGGALFFGAIPRINASRGPRYAALLAAGWSVVWLIRPLEAVILGLALAGLFLYRWFVERKGCWLHFVAPVSTVLLFTLGLTLLHNWRVTGDARLLPYQLGQKQYGVPQSFLGQKLVPPPSFRFQDIRDMYDMQRGRRELMSHPALYRAEIRDRLSTVWQFFVSYYFSVPVLIALWVSRKSPVLMGLVLVCAAAFTAESLYPFFFTRYFAPFVGVIVVLAMIGLRTLSGWTFRGKPFGVLLATGLVCLASMRSILDVERWLAAGRKPLMTPPPRYSVEKQLAKLPGGHLVLVRYSAHHNMLQEWVYNRADIDSAKIVWAREISPQRDQALLNYFAGRSIWYVNADDPMPVHAHPLSNGDGYARR